MNVIFLFRLFVNFEQLGGNTMKVFRFAGVAGLLGCEPTTANMGLVKDTATPGNEVEDTQTTPQQTEQDVQDQDGDAPERGVRMYL